MVNAPAIREPVEYAEDMIMALIPALSCTDPSIATMAIEGLKNLLENTALIGSLGILDRFSGAVAPLRDLILNQTWEPDEVVVGLIKKAASYLFHYTQYEAPGVELLLQASIVPALISGLSHDSNDVKRAFAVLVFGILHKAGSKDQVISALLEANFLSTVPTLMSNGTSTTAKQYCWNAMVVMLEEGSQAQYEILTDGAFLPEFLPTALEYYNQDNLDMKLEAAILMIKLWENGRRHGISVGDLITRFSPFQITEDLVGRAERFRAEAQQAIIFMRFARALNLN